MRKPALKTSYPVSPPEGLPSLEAAAKAPRIVIEAITPNVDEGRFPVKRCVGDRVVFAATVFCDGHDRLNCRLLWRNGDDPAWHSCPMQLLGNDRWEAQLTLDRVGVYSVTVEAWWDRFATFHHELSAKHTAGVSVALELQEGLLMVEAVAAHAKDTVAASLKKVLAQLAKASSQEQITLFLSPELQSLMTEAEDHPFLVRHDPPMRVEAERTAAGFSSWYELFPRSQTDSPTRHGTFLDVIERLPAIRDMGFDVLYFPPIHPIGTAHRKGRNNSLTPQANDPGSPYAIGSSEGGHDALHPQLGTLEDFQRMRKAASEHGLELALDFAVQCSQDHPWLKEHPGWFKWRPDGTIRYAENPPKKYQDIVNVDFYADDAVPSLWLALRDAVQFWIDQGVHIFRVDNPHTKPLPFWEWLIGDIRSRAPEALFLAEAFTRPAIMYRLGKIGFAQSYTYFTWRNAKQEITDYMKELADGPPSAFYRPHFFVNTPDINPTFLQTSGRPGFLIRAALAATLSGLWGLYSGFELCESAPVPGKEEYLDSEKYEIKPRDWNAPGNIVAEISALNRIRKENPALQTHLGIRFYNAFNDNILYYGKLSPDRDSMVLVAVNLDPHQAHETTFEVPLWEWSLPDHETLEVEDLMKGTRFTWEGKVQHVRLDPHTLPFAIWRVKPLSNHS